VVTATVNQPVCNPSSELRWLGTERASGLAGQRHLLRLWALPGQRWALGLWRAQDAAEMRAILVSLPLAAWLTVETTPLTADPNGPAITHS
jgi:muconolactone delta-isomerase